MDHKRNISLQFEATRSDLWSFSAQSSKFLPILHSKTRLYIGGVGKEVEAHEEELPFTNWLCPQKARTSQAEAIGWEAAWNLNGGLWKSHALPHQHHHVIIWPAIAPFQQPLSNPKYSRSKCLKYISAIDSMWYVRLSCGPVKSLTCAIVNFSRR